jgi:hypothetical protein
MRYVTTIERRAEQRGLEQGIEQTLRAIIADALEVRFTHVPEPILFRLTELHDPALLRALFRQALMAESLATFEESVNQLLPNNNHS